MLKKMQMKNRFWLGTLALVMVGGLLAGCAEAEVDDTSNTAATLPTAHREVVLTDSICTECGQGKIEEVTIIEKQGKRSRSTCAAKHYYVFGYDEQWICDVTVEERCDTCDALLSMKRMDDVDYLLCYGYDADAAEENTQLIKGWYPVE
jgi:hypothetical protein